MNRLRISLIVLSVLLVFVPALAAQRTPSTIIRFYANPETAALADVEAGENVMLGWLVVGMDGGQTLSLEARVLDRWVSLLDEGEILEAEGQRTVALRPTLTFAPPTYRLSLLDAEGGVLDRRYLIIPFAESEERAEIMSFGTNAQLTDFNALALGTARITVSWEVANRPSGSNIVFEQALADGRIVSVELPRPTLWVPSIGQGVVAPVFPGAGEVVALQLRVVDVATGDTLAEESLALRVGAADEANGVDEADETQVPPSTPDEIAEPTPAARPEVAFAAVPSEEVENTINLSWNVSGGTNVSVWLMLPDPNQGDAWIMADDAIVSGQPGVGSFAYVIPDEMRRDLRFQVQAELQDGSIITAQSEIIEMVCYDLFFDAPETLEQTTCAIMPPLGVQAAYQPFEGGAMIWRADVQRVYVLYDFSASGRAGWAVYEPTGTIEDVGASPPTGLYAPVLGLGSVWSSNPAVLTIGWATAPEQAYTAQIQQVYAETASEDRFYMTLPDGDIIFLYGRLGESDGGPAWGAFEQE